ncbi:ThuA domain-containing protein [Actinomadura sp. KC345]|uniref:ThuA domain-containing protein n=1 Tax=Actinomadura sp. KC345 TaxID=2530371 RepID=UPI0010522ABA|nr:ThuA domain-containing protein [Actinomadura sp. KC345]TDC55497.1 ThuA domain-containing protein [Actinomadura sp. KC345]
MSTKVLALTGGHSYDAEAFGGHLDHLGRLGGCEVTWVEQPEGNALIGSGEAATYDALLCYDMPGIAVRLRNPIRTETPAEAVRQGWRRLLEGGTGVVFVHHALASWPEWPEFAEIMGGSFLYRAGRVRGEDHPDSGYIEHVPEEFRVVADHPVTRGLPGTFRLPSDEPYLCPVFEDSIEVLVRRTGYGDPGAYLSSEHMVLTGEERHCATASPLVSDAAVWVRRERNSRIVYLQPGDDGSTFTDPHFRRLTRNAVAWVGEVPPEQSIR